MSRGSIFSARAFLLATGVVALATVIPAQTASAWEIDPTRVVSYTNYYTTTPNTTDYEYFTDDCTNFVSQTLHFAGMTFVGSPSGNGAKNLSSQWWGNQGSWTYSWSVADSLRVYLYTHEGYTLVMSKKGTSLPKKVPGAHVGDVVFYNWGSDPKKPAPIAQHAAIITRLNSKDPSSGWTGTLISEHSTNRAQAIWNLIPYNAKWASSTTASVWTH